jgi:hypothetical protein
VFDSPAPDVAPYGNARQPITQLLSFPRVTIVSAEPLFALGKARAITTNGRLSSQAEKSVAETPDPPWINKPWANEPIAIPSDFSLDLQLLVTANHELTLNAINKEEDDALEEAANSFDHTDDDEGAARRSLENHHIYFYGGLRRAANNLEVVALVTRVQHWLNKFANELFSRKDRGLIPAFQALVSEFGKGTVDADYFEKLVCVRDSVIHGDSQSSWVHGDKLRSVAPEYVNEGEVEVNEEQVKVAIAKSIEIVEWFNAEMEKWRAAKHKTP